MDNPPSVDGNRLTELKRTPQIVTCAAGIMANACNDFMVYKGTWEPTDF